MNYYQITTKGQITIPTQIRNSLSITQSDKFFFEVKDEDIVIKRKPRLADFAGALKSKMKNNIRITPEAAIRVARELKIQELKKKYENS